MEQTKLSDDFLVGVGIQRSILNMFGEVTSLGSRWDLNEFISTLKKDVGVQRFNIYNLSDAELLGLGFGKISDECNIRLIPAWLYQFLPDQIAVYGRDKPEPVVINKNQLGVPRLGYFGFGVLAKGTPISNKVEQAITPDEFKDTDVQV